MEEMESELPQELTRLSCQRPLTCSKLQQRLVLEGALGEQEPAAGCLAGVCQGPVNGGNDGHQHPHQRPWEWGRKEPWSQHPPKGAPSLSHPSLPTGHRCGGCFWGKKEIKTFPPRFTSDSHQNPYKDEGRNVHPPMAGGMLPMLLRRAVEPD